MKEQIRWIKNALASKEVVASMTYFLVKDGFIHAHNGRMTAACPIDEEGEFLVSGAEVEEVLNRLPGEAVIIVGEEEITLKHGRFRGKVKTLDTNLWGFPLPDKNWGKLPADLMSCVKVLRPFISDNATKPWALCICIRNGVAYATNNICCGRKTVSFSHKEDIMIPIWACDFLLDKDEPPTEWLVKNNYIAFRWADGAFMRAMLVNDAYPDSIEKIIVQAKEASGEAEVCEITTEWLQAFETVASSSDGSLLINAEQIIATRTKMDMEADIATPVTEDTYWDPRFIGAALRVASHFYPASWPKPCYFYGEYIDGVIMGRNS